MMVRPFSGCRGRRVQAVRVLLEVRAEDQRDGDGQLHVLRHQSDDGRKTILRPKVFHGLR